MWRQKSLGFSIRLICQRCLKTRGAQLKNIWPGKEAGTLLMPQHNNGMQRTLGNVSQLEM